MSKIKIGTSSCLLGENVRWNGGHCNSKTLSNLTDDYEFVSVCPEVGIGLGVPRPTIRLVEDIEDIGNTLLVSSKTGEDYTNIMEEYSINKVKELKELGINGFVLKGKSPTCGLRVKVYKEHTSKGSSKNGVGMFASVLEKYWPELPLTEEGRLNDNVLREKFIISTECHRDWNENVSKKDINSLVDFHKRHKYLLESLNVERKRELGNIVGNQKNKKDVYNDYYTLFFITLKDSVLTVDKICYVYRKMFERIMKDFDYVSKEDRDEFYKLLGMVKTSKMEKIVPKILLKHYIRKVSNKYLEDQKMLKL